MMYTRYFIFNLRCLCSLDLTDDKKHCTYVTDTGSIVNAVNYLGCSGFIQLYERNQILCSLNYLDLSNYYPIAFTVIMLSPDAAVFSIRRNNKMRNFPSPTTMLFSELLLTL